MKVYTMYIERADGKIARLVMDDDGSEDMWDTILGNFPGSYDLIGEDMVIPGYMHPDTWDESFGPGEGGVEQDIRLMRWLIEGETYDGDLYDGAHIHADNYDKFAAVTWAEDERFYIQYISLNPGDYKEIALGADPVADGWEDGCGKLVCRKNAEVVE